MRLIDADKLYKIIKDEVKSANKIGYTEEQEKWINQDMDLFMGLISEQPTAYDVDKVVGQLEKKRQNAFLTLANTGDEKLDIAYQNVATYLDEAIEIVKSGGINLD